MNQKNLRGHWIKLKNREYSLVSKPYLKVVTHKFRKASGITLVALVITIIVLLILAGVSINLVARK